MDASLPAPTARLLRQVAVVAAVDFVLLVALVAAAVSDREGVVSVLGPIHGLGFLLELFLTVRGAGEKRWGWWFPALVVVTAGAPGALIGHRRITGRARMAADPA